MSLSRPFAGTSGTLREAGLQVPPATLDLEDAVADLQLARPFGSAVEVGEGDKVHVGPLCRLGLEAVGEPRRGH